MKFRKKPVVIDAVQWTGNANEIESFMKQPMLSVFENDKPTLKITTLEGTMTAEPGDWIIRGIKGEFYPCKPDIFEATYEKVQL